MRRRLLSVSPTSQSNTRKCANGPFPPTSCSPGPSSIPSQPKSTLIPGLAGTLTHASPTCLSSIGERRIRDAKGLVKAYLSNYANWQRTDKKKGKPGLPGARNHPTLYDGARTVDQNRERWYTARNRSWPPHGVSYDQVRKTRMYRLF